MFCSVNERDELGDNLPPDYVTRVKHGGFYGWPWYYLGAHEDPRLKGIRPDLKDKITVPDTLIQAHSAPLGMTVYHAPAGAKHAFPKEFRDSHMLKLALAAAISLSLSAQAAPEAPTLGRRFPPLPGLP